MNSDNILFLFNPQSCSGKSRDIEQRLRTGIMQIWPGAEFITTSKDPSFWTEIPSRFPAKKFLIACGGDGTVHQAGNLAANTGAVLGIIPLGSGNDFAAAVGIPTDPLRALEHLRVAEIKKTDLLEIEGDMECFCLNTTGIGLDGLANHFTELSKPFLGKAAYHAGAIRSVLQSKPFEAEITLDGSISTQRLLMLTVCNGFREGGRFVVAPDAKTDDGKMNFLCVYPANKLKLLALLPKFVHRFPKPMDIFSQAQCKVMKVKLDEPAPLHIDGEYSGEHVQNLSITVLQQKLRVLA